MKFSYTVYTTFSDPQLADQWLRWLRGGHIAEVMKGGASDAEIIELDPASDGPPGRTRAFEVRYHFPSRESFAAFKEVVTRFPESRYAEDSAARMRYIVNSLAQYEVHVARYYMRRGAYLAAANRAQYAIKTYQTAPAVEEAVFVLVRAYDALGMNALRDDAARVMAANFPNSKFLSGKDVRPDVPWWRIWDPDW